MREKIVYILLIIGIFSCNRNEKIVKFFIENNSEINSTINVETYINNKLYRKDLIKKSNITKYKEFEVKNLSDTLLMRFIILETNEESSCRILKKDILKEYASVHVNFTETIFKEDNFNNSFKLNKDLIVKKGFYCEVMY